MKVLCKQQHNLLHAKATSAAIGALGGNVSAADLISKTNRSDL